MRTACSLCSWRSEAAGRQVVACLAAWHVYEEHQDAWKAVIGSGRPPRDPDVRRPEERAWVEAADAAGLDIGMMTPN